VGGHKGNPVAHMAHQASMGDIMPLAASVTEFDYQYATETVLEPNKAKKAELFALMEAELAAGKEPKDVNTHFELRPEDQDLVVYHRIVQLRRLKVVNQTVAVMIRGSEKYRMPLHEVMNRAQEKVDGGPSENKA
jgi:hypothetical protein